LRQITGASSIVDRAEKSVGDTHIGKRKLKVGPGKDKGKRKLKVGPRKDKGKKAKMMDEAVLGSDESTLSPDEG
jgi:hypothetical protein